ncbi:MAG: histidine phosphatase family protein [Burkholderiales bacterium]|nr:histidine phosphatase family protein [Burkholderiales bacterium]
MRADRGPTRPSRRHWLLAAPAWLATTGLPDPASAAEVPMLPLAEAATRLAAGGHVLMMRHARTVAGVGDPPGYRLDDCSSQRNLSDDGREQSRRIGAALRGAGVSIGEVRSSAWCRCRDTATLAFGAHRVWQPLNSFFDGRTSQAEHTAPVLALVLAHRAPEHLMLVTHQVNITAASGVYPAQGQVVALRARAGVATALFTFDPLS